MSLKTLFILQTLLLVLIGIVHYFSLEYFWYWQYPLLNRVVHFSGGLWVALASIWGLRAIGFRSRFIFIMTIVAFMSIGWEIFEILIGMTREADYVRDTVLDLVMDTCGGITGYLLTHVMLQLSTHAETTEARTSEPHSGS